MNIHTAIRAKGPEGLSDEQIYRVAPSVFAVTAHESRSERFTPIATIDVLNGLRKEGFVVSFAGQSQARSEGRREFTKHILRLRHLGETGRKLKVGDTFGEIVLKNANDGTSVYEMMAGMLRLACLNGMVTQDATFGEVKVRHVGKDVIGNVIEGSYRVLEETERKLAVVEDWSQIRLSREEQVALATSARAIRFADAEGEIKTPVTAEQLLVPRRLADQADDLWTIGNRIQESCIKGNIRAFDRTKHRRVTTRPVTGIDQDIRVNRGLWLLFENMAAIKRGDAIAA